MKFKRITIIPNIKEYCDNCDEKSKDFLYKDCYSYYFCWDCLRLFNVKIEVK